MSFHLAVTLLAGVALAWPAPPQGPASTRLVYEFGPGTWIENAAARANGDLLLTSLGAPGYLTLLRHPTNKPEPVSIKGFEFQDTLGIVEATPDVFYVLSSNFSLDTISAAPGSNAVWQVDFTKHKGDELPVATKAVAVPEATFLNGLTAFNSTLLLAADSAKGVVWAIDLVSKKSFIAADDPLMKPDATQASYLEGINGLHLTPSFWGKDKSLCFTNSQQYVFACIELDCEARAVGKARVVARPQPEDGFSKINWDDFSFDRTGTAFVATEKGNSVQRVSPDGKVAIVAGGLNATTIAEPTSTVFGRGREDSSTLYALTAGGLAFPVVQNRVPMRSGAQVVAIDLGRGPHAW